MYALERLRAFQRQNELNITTAVDIPSVEVKYHYEGIGKKADPSPQRGRSHADEKPTGSSRGRPKSECMKMSPLIQQGPSTSPLLTRSSTTQTRAYVSALLKASCFYQNNDLGNDYASPPPCLQDKFRRHSLQQLRYLQTTRAIHVPRIPHRRLEALSNLPSHGPTLALLGLLQP